MATNVKSERWVDAILGGSYSLPANYPYLKEMIELIETARRPSDPKAELRSKYRQMMKLNPEVIVIPIDDARIPFD